MNVARASSALLAKLSMRNKEVKIGVVYFIQHAKFSSLAMQPSEKATLLDSIDICDDDPRTVQESFRNLLERTPPSILLKSLPKFAQPSFRAYAEQTFRSLGVTGDGLRVLVDAVLHIAENLGTSVTIAPPSTSSSSSHRDAYERICHLIIEPGETYIHRLRLLILCHELEALGESLEGERGRQPKSLAFNAMETYINGKKSGEFTKEQKQALSREKIRTRFQNGSRLVILAKNSSLGSIIYMGDQERWNNLNFDHIEHLGNFCKTNFKNFSQLNHLVAYSLQVMLKTNGWSLERLRKSNTGLSQLLGDYMVLGRQSRRLCNPTITSSSQAMKLYSQLEIPKAVKEITCRLSQLCVSTIGDALEEKYQDESGATTTLLCFDLGNQLDELANSLQNAPGPSIWNDLAKARVKIKRGAAISGQHLKVVFMREGRICLKDELAVILPFPLDIDSFITNFFSLPKDGLTGKEELGKLFGELRCMQIWNVKKESMIWITTPDEQVGCLGLDVDPSGMTILYGLGTLGFEVSSTTLCFLWTVPIEEQLVPVQTMVNQCSRYP